MRNVEWYVERNEKLHNALREYEMREDLLKKDAASLAKQVIEKNNQNSDLIVENSDLRAKLDIAVKALKAVHLDSIECTETAPAQYVLTGWAFEKVVEALEELGVQVGKPEGNNG